MGDVVNMRGLNGTVTLRGTVVTLDSDVGTTFIRDCCRYLEDLLSEDVIKARYEIDEANWAGFADNGPLRQAVENETARRISNGDAAREHAQQLFIGAPAVLGDILHGDGVSPRHKIESAKELRAIAANGPAAAPASDRFIISIVLNSDDGSAPHVLHFDKSIKPDPHDGDDRFNDTDDTTPQGLLPIIAANKSKGGNDGEPI